MADGTPGENIFGSDEGIERLLQDTEGSLDPRIEAALTAVRQRGSMTDGATAEAKAIIGVSMKVMQGIDGALTARDKRAREALGMLGGHHDIATFAASAPVRMVTSSDPAVQLAMLREVLGIIGFPEALPAFDKLGLKLAITKIADAAPGLFMKVANRHVRGQVGDFVNVEDSGTSAETIVKGRQRAKAKTGIGSIINHVTEAAKTKAEARKAIDRYKEYIRAGAEELAIKPTAIVALADQPIATNASQKKLTEALKEIFAEADKHRLPNGKTAEITIDSEQSGLLEMTRNAFLEASRAFPKVRVKIVAQSYLQDTEECLVKPVLEASRKRDVARGEEPIGFRLVGGANLVGEVHEASITGIGRTPLTANKVESDANFLRIMYVLKDVILEGKTTLTVGTMNVFKLMHNLIELARAGVFAAEHKGKVSFAMLKGMLGQETFRYLRKEYNLTAINFSEYIPVITLEDIVKLFDFHLRRVQELVGHDPKHPHFVKDRSLYSPASDEFIGGQVTDGYLAAVEAYHTNKTADNYPLQPGRRSNRGSCEKIVTPSNLADFKMMASADWKAPEVRKWAEGLIADVRDVTSEDALPIPLSTAVFAENSARRNVAVKGRTKPDVVLANVEYADTQDIDHAFDIAKKDPTKWGQKTALMRADILCAAMPKLIQQRDELIKALMLNIGKALPEADGEVNEAIDFLHLSIVQLREFLANNNDLDLSHEGNGTALVICPKNFPQAIPLVHIVARLLAGYRVIVKPSGGEDEEAILATYEMVKCLHEAGVPEEALIFLPCDNKKAAYLTSHPDAERGGFTGSTAIAATIHRQNPKLDLLAETGGRNIIVLDSTVKLEDAAVIIAKSICGFGGQKCSKPVAVIATKDVDMGKFKAILKDIMMEMLISTPFDIHADGNPLSKKRTDPSDPFYQARMNLRPGESWLLKPEKPESCTNPELTDADFPSLREVTDWTKFDFAQLEEIFAPDVTIMQIDGDIPSAIDMIKTLPGTLTGALLSTSDTAQIHAINNWHTGNLYMGVRGPTAALAQQLFGDGVGDSHRGAHGAPTGSIEFLLMNGALRKKTGIKSKYEKVPVAEDKTGLSHVLQRLAVRHEERRRNTGNTARINIGSKTYTDEEIQQQLAAAYHAGQHYLDTERKYFSKKRATPGPQIIGQNDWVESKAIGKVMLRISAGDNIIDVLGKTFASIAAGNPLVISIAPEIKETLKQMEEIIGFRLDQAFPHKVTVQYQSDVELGESISSNDNANTAAKIHCLMYSRRANIAPEVAKACAALTSGLYIDGREVTGNGRNDMTTQYRQQSYCRVFHRGGDINLEELRLERRGAMLGVIDSPLPNSPKIS